VKNCPSWLRPEKRRFVAMAATWEAPLDINNSNSYIKSINFINL
jgi:hypothetical protein